MIFLVVCMNLRAENTVERTYHHLIVPLLGGSAGNTFSAVRKPTAFGLKGGGGGVARSLVA